MRPWRTEQVGARRQAADAAVSEGAGLLVLYCLLSYKKEKKETAR